MEPDRLGKRYRQKRSSDADEPQQHSRSKRAIPHIIYPEILVIVDYDGYRLHGGDNIQVHLHNSNLQHATTSTTLLLLFILSIVFY